MQHQKTTAPAQPEEFYYRKSEGAPSQNHRWGMHDPVMKEKYYMLSAAGWAIREADSKLEITLEEDY